jgi:chromosome segregation ATPase
MVSGKHVADRVKNARQKSAKLLARGAKIEARLAAPKTKLDLVVATMNDINLRKDKIRAKGGPGSREKIAKLDTRYARLAKRRATLEKRVAPYLARLETIRGRLEKHTATIQRNGG